MPIALFYTKTPCTVKYKDLLYMFHYRSQFCVDSVDNTSFNLDDNASGDSEGDCRLTTKIM